MPLSYDRRARFRIRSPSVKAAILFGGLSVLVQGNVMDDALAAFSLNWQRDYAAEGATFNSNNAYVVCNMSYIADANCSTGGFGSDFELNGSHKDNTAFLQEQLTIGGQLYFHVIVGDHTRDSMAQEVFIKVTGSNPTFGGFGGVRVSDSVANSADDDFNTTGPYSNDSSKNGNGSANPNSVIMRQIVNSGEISMEFLKDSFTQKPRITQTISNAQMISTTTLDMRGKNYSDITPINTATSVVNTLVLLESSRQGTEGDYDIQADASTSYLSAGGFTYTAGSGYGGSGGVYTWSDPVDNFQPMNRGYGNYCNPSENPNWSGNGACVNGTASGGGGWGGGGWGW